MAIRKTETKAGIARNSIEEIREIGSGKEIIIFTEETDFKRKISKQRGISKQFTLLCIEKKSVLPKRAMLTDKKKKYYRNLLVGRLDTLLTEANSTVGNILGLKHESSDPLDQANVEADRNFTLRIKHREEEIIREIEHALGRLDEGTFGLCELCTQEIPEKRLKVYPMTTLCIQYQREQETKKRIKGL